MRDIEQIKIELTLKKLANGSINWFDIGDVFQNDDLRTFMCSLGNFEAFLYAKFIDKAPTDETREKSYTKSLTKRAYIREFGE